MTKKKVKEEIRKPDVLLVAIERVFSLVKQNPRPFIIAGVIVVVLAAAVAAFAAYTARQDARAQYQLSQAMDTFGEYKATKKDDALARAETEFRALAREAPRGVSDVAKLYLARIAQMKGKPEDAKSLYSEVAAGAADSLVRKLAQQALKRPAQATDTEAKPPQK